MALFEWEDKYSINVAEIDERHKSLVSIISELHETMELNQGKETLKLIIDKLVHFTNYHFITEEIIMEEKGYPEREEHKMDHTNLRGQVISLRRGCIEGRIVRTFSLSNFLQDWLSEHIMEKDKAFGVFLNSKGIY